MPKALENKLKKEYGANSAIPYKIMNKMGVMHGNKEVKHHSGKGTRARLNTAADKMFYGSNN